MRYSVMDDCKPLLAEAWNRRAALGAAAAAPETLDYAVEINRLRNVIQAACTGGLDHMLARWIELFPDAPVPTVHVAPSDTKRLDWLEKMVVMVRVPRRYGSGDLFCAAPELAEGDGQPPSDLRTKIDEAIAGLPQALGGTAPVPPSGGTHA